VSSAATMSVILAQSFKSHLFSTYLLTLTLQVFLNIVLDDAVEEKDGGEKVRLGMVVGSHLRNCDWIVS
jgi:hypothetical protein